MRTVSDRIRHALSFEIIGLILVVPIGALAFDHPMQDIGVITIVSSIVATVWNYLYNWGFDHALQRLTGSVVKSWPVRIGHAVLFEAGLVALLMSFENFNTTLMLVGSDAPLPITMYGQMREGATPAINAVSLLVMLAVGGIASLFALTSKPES